MLGSFLGIHMDMEPIGDRHRLRLFWRTSFKRKVVAVCEGLLFIIDLKACKSRTT